MAESAFSPGYYSSDDDIRSSGISIMASWISVHLKEFISQYQLDSFRLQQNFTFNDGDLKKWPQSEDNIGVLNHGHQRLWVDACKGGSGSWRHKRVLTFFLSLCRPMTRDSFWWGIWPSEAICFDGKQQRSAEFLWRKKLFGTVKTSNH